LLKRTPTGAAGERGFRRVLKNPRHANRVRGELVDALKRHPAAAPWGATREKKVILYRANRNETEPAIAAQVREGSAKETTRTPPEGVMKRLEKKPVPQSSPRYRPTRMHNDQKPIHHPSNVLSRGEGRSERP